jgi:transposase-like protein
VPPRQRLAQLAAEAAGAPTASAALRKIRELRRELEGFERSQVAQALAEGASFAAIARDLGLSRQAVHRRFRSLAGADALTAPNVRRVLGYAREEAAAAGAAEVRSEHVLLGVLRVEELPAATLLRAAGLTLDRARVAVQRDAARQKLFRREPSAADDLHALLAGPVREGRPRVGNWVEVEHVLLAALEDTDSGASRTLQALGVDAGAVAAHLSAILGTYPSPAVARSSRRGDRHPEEE